MGGPGIGILTALEPEVVEVLVRDAISDAGNSFDDELRAFRDQHGLPYGYTVQRAAVDREPDELQRLQTELQVPIRTEAVVMAFVSDERCRMPLASLAQAIASVLQGWVDVDGDISRPYGPEPIADLFGYLNRTGRCQVIDGSLYLDAAAMLAWLRHPAFHVIK